MITFSLTMRIIGALYMFTHTQIHTHTNTNIHTHTHIWKYQNGHGQHHDQHR